MDTIRLYELLKIKDRLVEQIKRSLDNGHNSDDVMAWIVAYRELCNACDIDMGCRHEGNSC